MKKVLLFILLITGTVSLSSCDTTVRVDCNVDTENPLCQEPEPVVTDCEKTDTCEESIMKLKTVELLSKDTVAGELLEFRINTEGIKEAGNVYDSSFVTITMTFEKDGNVITQDAFWYQDYNELFNEGSTTTPKGISGTPSTEEDEIQGVQTLIPIGEGEFRVRVNLPVKGDYNYTVELSSEGKSIETVSGVLPINYDSTDYKGFLEIQDNRYFAFGQTDESFIPIGQNNAWYTSSTRKDKDYQVWFSEMNEAGMNASRIWMATWGFALEWGNDELHNYDNRQNQAFRLDQVLNYADESDIYFLLTILNHGQFSYSTNAEWDNNPWNEDNGGLLTSPTDFFKDEEAKTIFKDQLRYIVSRYGYSDNIMAWELFNEVDWIDNYNSYIGKQWHDEMATYLKSIDPNHLVTTSVKGTDNYLFTSDVLDFINAHDYGYSYRNINTTLPSKQLQIVDKYSSPVWMSEIGVNWEGGSKTYDADETGVSLRQQTWAGALGGGLGGAMNWWWDSYVNPYDLYHQFTGFSIYAEQMDLTGTDFDHLSQLDGVEVSNNKAGLIGYRIDDRVYGYVYNTDFSHMFVDVPSVSGIQITIPLSNGTYSLRIFDTVTGEIVKTQEVTVTNNMATINYGAIQQDSAFIIE